MKKVITSVMNVLISKTVTFKIFGASMIILLILVSGNVTGQTSLISPTGDGGFETGTTLANNNWTVVNAATNTWQVGTAATAIAGSTGIGVSNGGEIALIKN